mmetsp:Transcript_13945/g.21105  ORF Transcript_13945/g.21105 Transcript_13945/m.21105 type:complete len:206 (+) Transcript_13945:87-704(+)
MSIMEYNGSAVVAMAGKNCVAIASDTRLGIKLTTVDNNFQKVFKVNNKCFVGLCGLASDVQTVHEKIKYRTNMYKLKENRDINPTAFANMMSSLLYEKRFGPWFTEPVICGLEGPNNKPFLCAQDFIGAAGFTESFVVGGTSTEALQGMCESLWQPDMDPDALFECISQCLLAAIDRDCLSGWGAVVHVITPDQITTRKLKTRQD